MARKRFNVSSVAALDIRSSNVENALDDKGSRRRHADPQRRRETKRPSGIGIINPGGVVQEIVGGVIDQHHRLQQIEIMEIMEVNNGKHNKRREKIEFVIVAEERVI